MQKYYHKGAFYMDEDSVKDTSDVRLRAADAATGEDKFNKEALPQVMQVKNFGRAGQTKYTHLLDQDTTRKGMGSVWQQSELDRKQGVIGEVRNRWRYVFVRRRKSILFLVIFFTFFRHPMPSSLVSIWWTSLLTVFLPLQQHTHIRTRRHQLAGTGEIDKAGRKRPNKK